MASSVFTERLPVEIWAEIFSHDLQPLRLPPTSPSALSKQFIHEPNLPLQRDLYREFNVIDILPSRRAGLRLVCKQWNFIVCTSPQLWKDIVCSSRQDPKTLGIWMERAHHLPMTVTIRFSFGNSHRWDCYTRHNDADVEKTKLHIRHVFDYLIQYRQFIVSLEISTLCSVEIGTIIENLSQVSKSENLHTFGLHHRAKCYPNSRGSSHPFDFDREVTFGHISFQLQTLMLSRIRLSHLNSGIKFDSLRVLDIEFDEDSFGIFKSSSNMIRLLVSCQYLEILRLTIPFLPTIYQNPLPVELPKLLVFNLTVLTSISEGTFWPMLCFPNLEAIAFTLYANPAIQSPYEQAILSFCGYNQLKEYHWKSCFKTIQTLTLTLFPILDYQVVAQMLEELVLLRSLLLHAVSSKRNGVSRILEELVDSCIRVDMASRRGGCVPLSCPRLEMIRSYDSNGITENRLAGLRKNLGQPIRIIIEQRTGFHV